MSLAHFITQFSHTTHEKTLSSFLSTYESLVHTPPAPPAQSVTSLRTFANEHPTYILRSIYWIRQHSPITLFHEYILLQVSDGGGEGCTRWIRIDRRAGGDFRLSLLWLPSEKTKNEVTISDTFYDVYDASNSRVMGTYFFTPAADTSEGKGERGLRIVTVARVLDRMMELQTQYRIWSSNCWTWSRAIFLIFTSRGDGGMDRALDLELERCRRSTRTLITTDILRMLGAGVAMISWAGLASPLDLMKASVGLVGSGAFGAVVGEVIHRLTIGRRVGEWNVFVGEMEVYFQEMRKTEWKAVGGDGEVTVDCELQ